MSLLAPRAKLAHGGDINCMNVREVCEESRDIPHGSKMQDRYQTSEMLSEARRAYSAGVAPQYPGATMEAGLTSLQGALEHITGNKGTLCQWLIFSRTSEIILKIRSPYFHQNCGYSFRNLVTNCEGPMSVQVMRRTANP